MPAEIQFIVNAVRDLKPERRQELAAALALIDAGPTTLPDRKILVSSILGMYKHVSTASETFPQRKAEETELESRP